MTDPKKLIEKYNKGLCTAEEKALVESWYLKEAEETESTADFSYDSIKAEIWTKIKNQRPAVSPKKSLLPQVAAAAIIIMAIGVSFYYYMVQPNYINNQSNITAGKIEPGTNKAILTLANGKKINLSELDKEDIIEQPGIKISKNEEGLLTYTLSELPSNSTQNKNIFNTIETPVGGKFKVILPDGTMVWLNAASSLHYPISFTEKERSVRLTGEAYFDVAHNKAKPFKVISNKQTIEVLGTQFNVNSYSDEPDTRTTLIEGSVKVSNLKNIVKILKPGQRAVLTQQGIAVEVSAIDQDISWKNGDFAFEGSSLATIMRQISRWYDVEVVYKGATADVKFGGSISMSKSLEEVLKVLEMTEGVNFKLEGRRVLVMP